MPAPALPADAGVLQQCTQDARIVKEAVMHVRRCRSPAALSVLLARLREASPLRREEMRKAYIKSSHCRAIDSTVATKLASQRTFSPGGEARFMTVQEMARAFMIPQGSPLWIMLAGAGLAPPARRFAPPARQ